MKKILINETPWQTRIAITRDNLLQNIYFWSFTTEHLERSFYKGLATKVLPGIQTAFLDIGQERSGFLHISEIDRELALTCAEESSEIEDTSDQNIGNNDEKKQEDHLNTKECCNTCPDKNEKPINTKKEQVDIKNIVKQGENILVQVSKEPIASKGAKLTTCFTLPGRFVVLMPNIPRIGISKKIESKEERQRLKEILEQNLPEGMGAIIRTTSESKEASKIVKDLSYLVSTWKGIVSKYEKASSGEKLYEDIDLSLQVIRDHLDKDVEAVVCDNKVTQNRIYKFVKNIAPEFSDKIRYYQGPPSLFDKFNIEKQISQALKRKVILKSGGSIVIEATEAMTVIDVNTGRYIGKTNLEDTVLKTNLEAAEEIVRQLRLRNIGGLIVIDFIDMCNSANKQKLYKYLEKILKERDKFQSVVLKISEFGLVQMTRKRSGKTLTQLLLKECNCCHGSGHIKSISTESYEILRHLNNELEKFSSNNAVKLTVHPSVFNYITNIEYNSILYLEKKYKSKITLVSQDQCSINDYKINI